MTGCLTKLKAEVDGRLGCGTEVVEDRDLGCSCKFEFARNYARKHHVLRVNPARCVNDYPVFYNLLNVKLQLQALDDGSLGVVQPVSNAQESNYLRANGEVTADDLTNDEPFVNYDITNLFVDWMPHLRDIVERLRTITGGAA